MMSSEWVEKKQILLVSVLNFKKGLRLQHVALSTVEGVCVCSGCVGGAVTRKAVRNASTLSHHKDLRGVSLLRG